MQIECNENCVVGPIIHFLAFCFFVPVFSQMYLVIFPEGTRYNPELKNVIAESQAFAAKEGTSKRLLSAAAHLLHFNSA